MHCMHQYLHHLAPNLYSINRLYLNCKHKSVHENIPFSMKFCIILFLSTIGVGLSVTNQNQDADGSFPKTKDDVIMNSETLIANGEFAPLHAYPFLASLQQLDGGQEWVHRCAGSIIGSNRILTTAYCVETFFNGNLNEYRAVAGTNNISSVEAGAQIRSFVEGYMHPKYSRWTQDYDYFVVYVDDPFNFQNNTSIVRPIKLPDPSFEPIGVCSTTGWGETSENDDSTELLHVNLTVIPRATCEQRYGSIGIEVTHRMICAGEDGKEICWGDYGGPLVCDNTLVGVASRKYGPCGRSEFPSVFSNVAEVIDWIKSV